MSFQMRFAPETPPQTGLAVRILRVLVLVGVWGLVLLAALAAWIRLSG